MKKYLSKDEILNAADIKTEEVTVPEWGGVVRVAQVNAAARCRMTMLLLDNKGEPLPAADVNRIMTVGLVAASVVDADGNTIFTEKDIEALGKKSAVALDKVFAVADRLNGISIAMQEKLRKN